MFVCLGKVWMRCVFGLVMCCSGKVWIGIFLLVFGKWFLWGVIGNISFWAGLVRKIIGW